MERIFEDVRGELDGRFSISVWRNHLANRGILPRLRAALEARRQKAVVRHVLGDAHFLAWLLPKPGTVLTILDCGSHGRLTGWRARLYHLLWYTWPMRRAARITTISEFSRSEIARLCGCDADDLVVIPPPLSPEFHYSPPRPHSEWSRILHFTALPNKNSDRAVEALAGLDVTLVTVGVVSPRLGASIRRLGIRHEPHVDVTRDRLAELYRSCDILLFPSTYEGFGMPVIEAQATGRPVVAGNVAALPETAAGAACMVDPHDVGAIRDGVVRVLRDSPYSMRLIEAGRVNAQRFRIDEIARQYETLYRQVAAEAGAVNDTPPPGRRQEPSA